MLLECTYLKSCIFFCSIAMGLKIINIVIFMGFLQFAHQSDHSLQQVIFLYRHGNRAPIEPYPNDPHANYTWEGGWGALTTEGKSKLRKLGEWIRQNYGFLNNFTCTTNNTEVISSHVNRCIESSEALLSGLCPDNNSSDQRIPVYAIPRNIDNLLYYSYPCPRLSLEVNKTFHDEEKNRSHERRSFFNKISNLTGKIVRWNYEMNVLLTTLQAQLEKNMTIPQWADDLIFEETNQISRESFYILTSNVMLKRLIGGPLLKKFIQHVNDYSQGKSHIRMHIYAAHDNTLVNFLRTIGISNYAGKMFDPGFGATVILELRKNEHNRYYVVVKYMSNSALEQTVTLPILSCGEFCYLDEIESTLSAVIPVNWVEECQLN